MTAQSQSKRTRVSKKPATITGPLSDRRIVVTGASSGIGRAAAQQLARRGAHVLLLARRTDELNEVVRHIEAEGGHAEAYPVDLSDLDALDVVADRILKEHGGVDVLVNNAGRSIRRPIKQSLDRFHDYQRTMQINYFAPVRLTLKFLPSMLEAGDGHVINVLTWGTLMPAPRFSAYIGSKCALEGFSKSLASELGPNGIAVTTVHYPIVHTPMIAPTPLYQRLPGLSPEQAGGWIVRAVLKRPARMAPSYALAGGMHAYVFPKAAAKWIRKLGI